MRIGVLTTSYPRAPADLAGRFVAELDAWLADHGCTMEVWAPAPACSEHPGVRVRAIQYARRPRLFGDAGAPDRLLGGSWRARAHAWSQSPAFVGKLAACCHDRARHCDALISHWLLPGGVVAARAGRSLPHLAIAHATDVHLIERLPTVLAASAMVALARRRTRLVLTREALREPLLRAAPKRARWLVERAMVQRMGVHIWGAARRPAARRARPRVVFIGRLIALKGLAQLLDALEGLNVEVIIAGDGPERDALVARAEDLGIDARFVGVVGGEHKREILASADVFVLPSITLPDGRSDGAPVTLLEAMAAGVCVVASRVGDVATVAPHQEAALLVKSGDVAELRATLIRALGDAELRRTLGARAASIAKLYDWNVVGARLLHALRQLEEGGL